MHLRDQEAWADQEKKMLENYENWTQLITFSLAVLGAVLGVLNTWRNIDQCRVKLRVIPKQAIPVGGMDERLGFCVEVINLSAIPVTVSDVGVLYRGTDSRACMTINPIMSPNGDFPRRLEPRSAFTVYSEVPRNRHKLKCAYAKTDCGVQATGSSQAFRGMRST